MMEALAMLLASALAVLHRVLDAATTPLGFTVALLAATTMLMVAYADHVAQERVE